MVPRRLRKIGRVIYWAIFSAAIMYVLIFLFGSEQIGYLTARYDLWKGCYKIKTYGYPPSVLSMAEILKEYGIDCVPVAGCVVNDLIIKEVAAYNLVMKKAIKRDLGVDIDRLLNGDEESDMPKMILETPEPEEGENALYEISHCFQTLVANFDSDDIEEKVCLSTLKYQGYNDAFPYTSLIVDVYKADKKILRQELDRTFYYQEQFV